MFQHFTRFATAISMTNSKSTFLAATRFLKRVSYLPSSFNLPTRTQAWRPSAMSHIMSASFFCTS